MSVAHRLQDYLQSHAIPYDLVTHDHTASSMQSAAAAHVPGDRLAKAVILKDEDDYLMMVVPADHHIHLGALHHKLGRTLGLATEAELADLFPDCERGAAPPVGEAYGLHSMVDKDLLQQSEVLFEAGDHEHLIKMRGADFRALQAGAEAVDVARHI